MGKSPLYSRDGEVAIETAVSTWWCKSRHELCNKIRTGAAFAAKRLSLRTNPVAVKWFLALLLLPTLRTRRKVSDSEQTLNCTLAKETTSGQKSSPVYWTKPTEALILPHGFVNMVDQLERSAVEVASRTSDAARYGTAGGSSEGAMQQRRSPQSFPPCSFCALSSPGLPPLVHVRRFSSVYVFCSMDCYAKFTEQKLWLLLTMPRHTNKHDCRLVIVILFHPHKNYKKIHDTIM